LKLMKRRYLAVSIESHEPVSSHEFMDAAWEAVSKLFGEYGASQTGLSLIDYDETKKLGVLRTWHKTLEMSRTALASITHIRDKRVALHVLAVSGTIRALHRKLEKQPCS
jgi:ribonuclease P/MRP protein subunit POP5